MLQKLFCSNDPLEVNPEERKQHLMRIAKRLSRLEIRLKTCMTINEKSIFMNEIEEANKAEDKNRMLQQDFQKLQQVCSELTEITKMHQGKLKAANLDINELINQSESIRESIDTEERRKRLLEANLLELEEDIKRTETAKKQLADSVVSKQNEMNELKELCNDLVHKKEQSISKLEAMQKEIQRHESFIKLLKKEEEQHMRNKATNEEEMSNLRRITEELNRKQNAAVETSPNKEMKLSILEKLDEYHLKGVKNIMQQHTNSRYISEGNKYDTGYNYTTESVDFKSAAPSNTEVTGSIMKSQMNPSATINTRHSHNNTGYESQSDDAANKSKSPAKHAIKSRGMEASIGQLPRYCVSSKLSITQRELRKKESKVKFSRSRKERENYARAGETYMALPFSPVIQQKLAETVGERKRKLLDGVSTLQKALRGCSESSYAFKIVLLPTDSTKQVTA